MPTSASAWIPAASAIAAAIISGYCAYAVQLLKTDVARLGVDEKAQELALEQRRLEDDQHQRLEKCVQENIPKLLGTADPDRRVATATLFALYPNDSKDILQRIATSGDQTASLQPAIKQAVALDETTGTWAVVLGSDTSLADARVEWHRAEGADLEPLHIYKMNGTFATVVENFPNQRSAEIARVSAAQKVRSSAFVINLASWCPARTPADGYTECARKG